MKYKVLMSIVIVALMFIPLACQHEELPELQCFPPNWTVENETEFLSLCDQCNITYFDKYEYGTRVSYCYQRYIGEAIVEGDKVSFSFDAETGELPQDNTQWREDLPDELPEIISKEEAMRIGEGTTAELCYISPNSIKFSVERIDHPCWVVGHWYGDTVKHKMSSDVVDAVTSSVIGHGGPGYSCDDTCSSEPTQDWVVTNETEFLQLCEQYNMTFKKYQYKGSSSYYHYRKIGEAKVFRDEIVYRFDTSGLFKSKQVTWREDLPDELPEILISKQEAMDIAGSKHKRDTAELYYIDVDWYFPDIAETPANPVWVVSIWKDYYFEEFGETETWNVNVVVVDAITGEILGHGTPIP